MRKNREIYENASMRKSYVGFVFDKGEKLVKKQVLNGLPKEWANLHNDGYIHIHDLDAYGITYNCLTFNLLNKIPYEQLNKNGDIGKILALFDYYKELISKCGNEQSGGMAFANFDCDTAEILKNVKITDNENNREIIKNCIESFIYWCNNAHERMGQVSYYVTLNIGLADNDLARFICESVIDVFEQASWNVFKPNIIFKVKGGINRFAQDVNYYLFQRSLLCTAKKMIPTYVLGDSLQNKDIDIKRLAIMGCRTRVVANLFGKQGSIGRGNISNITINLPRIAFEAKTIPLFKKKWAEIANTVVEILLDRYRKLLAQDKTDFPTNLTHDLWLTNFSDSKNTLESIFKNGTLSIGFIGLSEAVELLSDKKYWQDKNAYDLAVEIVSFMREYCDKMRDKNNLNFSLLATSGELISGRFPKLDKKIYSHSLLEKDFYTNSFHIEVDSNLSAFDKIEKESTFHKLCNGGCITYVELGEAPLDNAEGLQEFIEHAISNDVHYLGFNFPLDICNGCGEKGVFDICENCGGDNITRIRRVSGYLEILDYFTVGKKSEVKSRRKN